jgi:hypothetical protein
MSDQARGSDVCGPLHDLLAGRQQNIRCAPAWADSIAMVARMIAGIEQAGRPGAQTRIRRAWCSGLLPWTREKAVFRDVVEQNEVQAPAVENLAAVCLGGSCSAAIGAMLRLGCVSTGGISGRK